MRLKELKNEYYGPEIRHDGPRKDFENINVKVSSVLSLQIAPKRDHM